MQPTYVVIKIDARNKNVVVASLLLVEAWSKDCECRTTNHFLNPTCELLFQRVSFCIKIFCGRQVRKFGLTHKMALSSKQKADEMNRVLTNINNHLFVLYSAYLHIFETTKMPLSDELYKKLYIYKSYLFH